MVIETCNTDQEPTRNSFDSHICYAAAQPITDPESGAFERIYYMGGNGPHSGERNSSFALVWMN